MERIFTPSFHLRPLTEVKRSIKMGEEGPKKKKNPLLTFKPNFAIKVIISTLCANEKHSIPPPTRPHSSSHQILREIGEKPFVHSKCLSHLAVAAHLFVKKRVRKLMTAEHGDWVSNFKGFISSPWLYPSV